MAKSVDSAKCVNGNGWDEILTCDPFPTFNVDKETLIGLAAGLLVAASPIGGLVGRAVGGAVAGVAAAKMAKKLLKKATE